MSNERATLPISRRACLPLLAAGITLWSACLPGAEAKRSKALPITVTIAAAVEHPRQSESSIVELKDGSFLICWQQFLKSKAGAGDDGVNQLATMTSRDGGLTWAGRRVLIENNPGDVNVFSPSLCRLPTGTILLFYFRYHVLKAGVPPVTSGFVRRSNDEGRSFTNETTLWTRRPFGVASHTLRRLSTGRLILPLDIQVGNTWTANDHSVVGAMFSDDEAVTWRQSRDSVDLPLRGAMEGHIQELKDGRLMMVMRTQLGAVFQAYSSDGGNSWSKPQTTGLRQPETCPEMIRLSTGELMIVWCNAEYDPKFDHFGKRSPLTVAISRDEGQTWNHARNLADDPRKGYHNPIAFCSSKGRVVVAYTELTYSERWTMDSQNDHLKGAIFDVASGTADSFGIGLIGSEKGR